MSPLITHTNSRYPLHGPRGDGAPHGRDPACAADPPARPLGQKGIPPNPPQLPRSPYLPIIVECCCTAASSSLSRIVHSPIAVHPETKTLASGGDFHFVLPFPISAPPPFFLEGGKTNERATPLYRPQSSEGKAGGGDSPAGGLRAPLGSARFGWTRLRSGPRGGRHQPGPLSSWRGAMRRTRGVEGGRLAFNVLLPLICL